MSIRTVAALVLPLAALTVHLTLAPTDAWAGDYEVRSCSATSPGGAIVQLLGEDDAWSIVTNDAAHTDSAQDCPPPTAVDTDLQTAGLVVRTKLNSGGSPGGAESFWQLAAPPGATVSRLRMVGYAGKRSDSWTLFVRTGEGIVLAPSDCDKQPVHFYCSVGGFAVGQDWNVDTTALEVGISCTGTGGSCATGATRHDAWSAIYGSIVTIDDPTLPDPTGATGSLLSDGYVRGTVTAGVSGATDNTGIRALQIRTANDRVVATADRACDFTRRVPCTDVTAPESFSFDSTAIGDGTHTVQIGVLDSGRNFGAAATRQVTVDNTAPEAPAQITPAATTTTASAATVAWTAPANQVAPVTTAHVTVCGPAGCGVATRPAANGHGSAAVALDSHGTYTVRVSLQDAAGNHAPAAAATWTVTRTPQTTSAAASAPRQPAPTAKASPRLTLARPTVSRDRRSITVRGTVAPGVRGRITVQARTRVRGRARTVSRATTLRGRRFSVRLRLPAGAWRAATLTVRYAGSSDRRAQRLIRTVR